jgi:hypothetical protein
MRRSILFTAALAALLVAASAVVMRAQQPAPAPLPLGALAPSNIKKARPAPPFDLTGTAQRSAVSGFVALRFAAAHREADASGAGPLRRRAQGAEAVIATTSVSASAGCR